MNYNIVLSVSCSVVSDSETLWTIVCHVLYLWDSPGKNTGLSKHSLLQGTFPTRIKPGSLSLWGDSLPLSH